ncbi:MAG: Alcohol dehydrogenase, partial [uncultured Ramlibacter sp.]
EPAQVRLPDRHHVRSRRPPRGGRTPQGTRAAPAAAGDGPRPGQAAGAGRVPFGTGRVAGRGVQRRGGQPHRVSGDGRRAGLPKPWRRLRDRLRRRGHARCRQGRRHRGHPRRRHHRIRLGPPEGAAHRQAAALVRGAPDHRRHRFRSRTLRGDQRRRDAPQAGRLQCGDPGARGVRRPGADARTAGARHRRHRHGRPDPQHRELPVARLPPVVRRHRAGGHAHRGRGAADGGGAAEPPAGPHRDDDGLDDGCDRLPEGPRRRPRLRPCAGRGVRPAPWAGQRPDDRHGAGLEPRGRAGQVRRTRACLQGSGRRCGVRALARRPEAQDRPGRPAGRARRSARAAAAPDRGGASRHRAPDQSAARHARGLPAAVRSSAL